MLTDQEFEFKAGYNARDSNNLFGYMYAMCKSTTCDNCEFGKGEWISLDDDINTAYRCEMAVVKRKMNR